MAVASQLRSFQRPALAICLLALGCAKSGEPDYGSQSPKTAEGVQPTDKPIIVESIRRSSATPASVQSEPSADSKPALPANMEPTPAKATEVPSSVATYQPPFPDRVDMFVPPKRQGNVHAKEGGSEDRVELLGFIRVDRPKVVLSINGQVAAIPEGATELGIEVISIQQPKVVLQRGRQRWQASLEN